MRDFVLWLSIPIQKLMQKLHPPYAQTTISQAEEAMLTMQDGDVLLSRESWHFTNYFIPGFWSHAAIYGKGQVIESVAPKVQIIDFRDWVIEKHNWIVLRPRLYDEDVKNPGVLAFEFSKRQLGIGYDYRFNGLNKLWYCSELVKKAWCEFTFWAEDALDGDLTRNKACVPEDFYKAALEGKMTVIHEHRDKI